jgi:hypothetical protein
MMAPFPGQIIPPFLQTQLKLTPEQREKIDKIQKETEGKVMEVLTDEQRKQLEAFKKGFEQMFPRPPGGPRPPVDRPPAGGPPPLEKPARDRD